MKQTVLRAKVILSDKFNIDLSHFEKHTSRRQAIVEARRYLVFFLRHELDYTFLEIVAAIPSITNHATAIHHYNKMFDMMEFEQSTKKSYLKFYNNVMGSENLWVEKEIDELTAGRKLINKQIKKLKKLL